jgi:MoaA/NifB/PqqE/SkfB family radical SAM enzyme
VQDRCKVRETAAWSLLRVIRRLPSRWAFLLRLTYRRLCGGSSGTAELPIVVDIVNIDASTTCQLKCPSCPTGDGTSKQSAIGWGHLNLDDFKGFVDGHPALKHIELSNWGEIFLNPDLKDIISYAHLKNVSLSATNGVNLNTASDDVLEHMVKCGFKHLVCAIDGASEESYPVYRKGGSLRSVLDNIRKINLFKEKYRSGLPVLCWQFIFMGHNEHELPLARRMAEELGMDFTTKLNWDPTFSPVKDKDLVRKDGGIDAADRKEFEQKHKRDYKEYCHQLWVSPQINWDGKLLGCNRNYWGDFGNVFESGLDECLKSERYIYAKQMLLGEKKPRNDIPCTHCHHYKNMKRPRSLEEILDRQNLLHEQYTSPV